MLPLMGLLPPYRELPKDTPTPRTAEQLVRRRRVLLRRHGGLAASVTLAVLLGWKPDPAADATALPSTRPAIPASEPATSKQDDLPLRVIGAPGPQAVAALAELLVSDYLRARRS